MINALFLCRSIWKTRQLLDTPFQNLHELLGSRDLAEHVFLLVTRTCAPVACMQRGRTTSPSAFNYENSVIYTGCMSGLNRGIENLQICINK